jgi:hypothetical protein
MKSKAQVIRENSEFKSLINAVVKGLHGTESIQDINNYGIQGGYGEFCYYSDTHRFAIKNRKQIVKLLELSADMMGENDIVQMVSNFGAFRTNPMDREDRAELYKYLGGAKCEQSTITNLMAWFAAEEICRMFEE